MDGLALTLGLCGGPSQAFSLWVRSYVAARTRPLQGEGYRSPGQGLYAHCQVYVNMGVQPSCQEPRHSLKLRALC